MNFILQILGSSAAVPTFERFPTAQILTVNQMPYLIDCGEGTQIQMRRFSSKFGRIKHIFISHLHGDHFFGLFGLISSYALNGRTEDLHIFAHSDLKQILFNVFSPVDVENLSFKIIFHDLPEEKQVIFSDENVEVTAFPLIHNIETRGFLFKEKKRQPNVRKDKIKELNLTIEQIKALKQYKDVEIDGKVISATELIIEPPQERSFAFCSDTAYDEQIAEIVSQVDLLYNEATYCEKQRDLAKKYLHSTARDAALTAKNANAKALVIGHFSGRNYASECKKEAEEVFNNVIVAEDGMKIEVTKQHEIITI